MFRSAAGLQRLRIVRRQRQRQRDRVARFVQPIQAHQRDGAVVVRLDGTRRLASGLLGAGERAAVIGVVEQLGGAVQQRGDRRVQPGGPIREAATQRPRRRLVRVRGRPRTGARRARRHYL
jgi:hypothetical protein